MKQFHRPTLWTCLKSGAFLLGAAAIVIGAAFMLETTLMTGVIALMIGSLVYGRSLAMAGYDAMMVTLRQHSQSQSIMFVALALLGELFVALAIITLVASIEASTDSIINVIRSLTAVAVLAFMPLTVMWIANRFERP